VNTIVVGLQLLLTGMVIVFLVLLFLMYVMKVISRLAGERPPAEKVRFQSTPPSAELSPEELVAVLTALGKVLPPNRQAVVRISAQTAGEEDEAMMAAAITGALAVMKSGH